MKLLKRWWRVMRFGVAGSAWLAVSGGAAFTGYGAPFAKVIPFVQPDGTAIRLWGQGDEFHAVFETLDGFTVIYDAAMGAYCFARLSPDGNSLESTRQLVGQMTGEQAGVPKHLRVNPAAVKLAAAVRRQKWKSDLDLPRRWERLKQLGRPAAGLVAAGAQPPPPDFPTVGLKVGLTLLIDFDDDPATIARAEIVNFLNGDGYTGFGNNGSVKEYFRDNSNGLLTYSNLVTVYLRVPNSLHQKSWYNDVTKDCGSQGNLLIRDALQILKSLPNYNTEILPTFSGLTTDDANQVLACNVFFAGGNGGVWSKGLWPHSWALYEVGSQELSPGGKRVWAYQITDIGNSLELGTFCHENGHLLCGYPDIYDYDYDSVGGAGRFCLMNSGGHGINPAQICAYLKLKSGWATTVELSSNSVMTATVTASAGPAFNRFYRFTRPGAPTEYFLAENRQQTGRDAILPASGVAIWHVDELGDHNDQSLTPNSTHANYEVTLVQADNRWDFQNNINQGDATDLYFAGNAATGYINRLADATSPGARWWNGSASGLNFFGFSAPGAAMTFQVQGTGDPSPIIITPPAPTLVAAGEDATFAVIASGQAPLSQQWRRNGVSLVNSSHIAGADSDMLTIRAAQPADVGAYDVVVANGFGSVTSAPAAALTVATSPVITDQPAGLTVDDGSAVTFAVNAVGVAPLTYHWRKNLIPIAGATTSSYTLSAATTNNAGIYSVIVSNSYGVAVSSNAVLNVVPILSIGQAVEQPALTWATGGNTRWTGQSVVTHDGSDAAVSGILYDNEQTYFSTPITGPTNVCFWWKVSSETGYDFLEFRVSGNVKARISGEADWRQRNIYVGPGPQTLEWVYLKDYSVTRGADRGWVDEIAFGPPVQISVPDAVDATGLAWSSYGDADWFGEPDITHDGIDAGQSGGISDYEYTGASLQVSGPGRLTFWWKVSSEEAYDYLDVYVDATRIGDGISGEVDWEPQSVTLGPGTHFVDFEYSKDGSVSEGDDAGWIDQVTWISDSAPPLITRQPISQTVDAGQSAAITVEAVGAGTLSFQWRKGDSPLGVNTASLLIAAAQFTDAGQYSVVVGNANGAVTSAVATLTVLPPISLAEAVDATALIWQTGLPTDAAPWVAERGVTHDGVDAAQSGHLADGQQSTLETTVNGPGSVTYRWKISSETNFDFLVFYVDDAERARVSGEVDWLERTFSVGEGSHNLRWVYQKDPTVTVGQDLAWLDQVSFVVSNPPPTILSVVFTNQVFRVAVPTLTGRSYELEYKDSLAQPVWSALPAVVADGTTLWLTDPAATNTQRFYRVRSP